MRIEDRIEIKARREAVWEAVSNPDPDEIYEEITGTMQAKLDELAAERRLPLVG